MSKTYPVSNLDRARLERDFTYHAPVHPHQAEKYSDMRRAFGELAEFILTRCPPSRERSVALTQLELGNFEANAAIARYETAEDYEPAKPGEYPPPPGCGLDTGTGG